MEWFERTRFRLQKFETCPRWGANHKRVDLALSITSSYQSAPSAAGVRIGLPGGPSLDRWRTRALKPYTETEEGHQPFINRGDLFPRDFAEHAPDSALVDGSQVVDQRERPFREAALPRREFRIQKSFARSAGDWHNANQWKALVTDDLWVAHNYAGSYSPLFVSDGRLEFDNDHGAAAESRA